MAIISLQYLLPFAFGLGVLLLGLRTHASNSTNTCPRVFVVAFVTLLLAWGVSFVAHWLPLDALALLEHALQALAAVIAAVGCWRLLSADDSAAT